MDPKLMDLIDNELPHFNDLMLEGFHKHDLGDVVSNVHKRFKVILKSLECKGIYYKGLQPLNPNEIIQRALAGQTKTQEKAVMDIQKETLLPVKVLFDYDEYLNGNIVELNDKVINLPYVDKYGDLWIDGTQYSVQMVLTERCLSVTKENSIFLKFLGYKCKIGSTSYRITLVTKSLGVYKNSDISINLVSHRFYRAKKKPNSGVSKRPIPLLSWYVFAKKGFTRAMREDAECEYVIGDPNTITQTYCGVDNWTVYKMSSGVKIERLSKAFGLDVGIAIRPLEGRTKMVEDLAIQFVSALFMAIDIDEYLYDEYQNDIDNSEYWKLLIGMASIYGNETRERYLKYMNDHFVAIEGYLDDISLRKLQDQYINVSDIFELFNYISKNSSELKTTANRSSSLNKIISSSEFLLEPLFESATMFKQEVMNTTDLKLKKFKKYLNKYFRLNIIYAIKVDHNVDIKATPTDNPLADYLLEIIPQSKIYSSNTKGRKGAKSNDNSYKSDASMAFVFSWNRPTKPSPDGRGYLNPTIDLVKGVNMITIRKDCRQLYNETQKRLTKFERIKKE